MLLLWFLASKSFKNSKQLYWMRNLGYLIRTFILSFIHLVTYASKANLSFPITCRFRGTIKQQHQHQNYHLE